MRFRRALGIAGASAIAFVFAGPPAARAAP
jgi:hypothetical protein